MIRIIFILCFITVCMLIIINMYIILTSRKKIMNVKSIKNINDIDCILVLGAAIWGDRPSRMLKDRLLEAIDLYKNDVSKKIIMSGDHGKEDYNEVEVMKKFAVERNVSSKDVFMDHAGFSTYDSLYRAKEVFLCKKIVIVSQKYHLYRSIYIGNKLGLECYGVNSDPSEYEHQFKRDVREVLARVKDFIKCMIKPKSKYLGKIISIKDDGELTNDK